MHELSGRARARSLGLKKPFSATFFVMSVDSLMRRQVSAESLLLMRCSSGGSCGCTCVDAPQAPVEGPLNENAEFAKVAMLPPPKTALLLPLPRNEKAENGFGSAEVKTLPETEAAVLPVPNKGTLLPKKGATEFPKPNDDVAAKAVFIVEDAGKVGHNCGIPLDVAAIASV